MTLPEVAVRQPDTPLFDALINAGLDEDNALFVAEEAGEDVTVKRYVHFIKMTLGTYDVSWRVDKPHYVTLETPKRGPL